MSLRKRILSTVGLAGLTAGLVLTGATPAQATVRTIGPGVDATCTTDITAALQSYVDNTVVDGDTVQLPAGACYRLDGTLNLTDRNNLTFVGLSTGASLKMVTTPPATPKVRHDMINITGGSGITFRNLTFDSTNTSTTFDVNREWWPIFEINGTSNVLIDNVDATDVYGDYVQVGPDTRPAIDVMPNGVTVQNSTVDRVGRHAVSCGGCDNLTIDGNTFSDIAYQVFDLEVEGSAWHADNIWFTDNTITGYQHLSVVANAGIGQYVTDVTITGNNNTAATLQTCEPPVLVLDTPPTKDRWTVSGNSFDALGTGFKMEGVDHVTTQNNVVNLLRGGCTNQTAAISTNNSTNGLTTGNDFQGADRMFQPNRVNVTGTACGNRLSKASSTPTLFNKPTAC